MKEVYHFQDIAVLSEKEVNESEGSNVWFKDGSVVSLKQLSILNRGKGGIQSPKLLCGIIKRKW